MKTRIICLALAAATTLSGCSSHSIREIDNFIIVKQKIGAKLGYSPASGVNLLEADGVIDDDRVKKI